jgi:hypothetical protein
VLDLMMIGICVRLDDDRSVLDFVVVMIGLC